MSETKVTIHSIGSGVCSLTEKDGDGLTVSFDDGTVQEAFLSWRAFRQLLAMKASQGKKPEPKPAPRPEPRQEIKPVVPAVAVPAGNGPPK